MAYRSPTSSSGSQSPTPSSVSSNVSPASINVPLMVANLEVLDPRPHRYPADLTRSGSASKGGCWTCRLRRKTCIRLTIQWLIRGQPRSSLLSPIPGVSARLHDGSIRRQYPQHRPLGRLVNKLTAQLRRWRRLLVPVCLHQPRHNSMYPAIARSVRLLISTHGASNSAFYHLPAFNANIFNQFDSPVSSGTPQIPPQSISDFAQFGQDDGFGFNVRAPSPEQAFPLFAGHSSLQENHCIYYFEHLTNVTCSMIVSEPRGAVTNAVCALASLHYTPPETNPEHSTAKYFHDERISSCTARSRYARSYNESDAIAALHLVWFSQLSGGATDWTPVFAVACDWVAQQTDLLTNDTPKLALRNLSTQWLDIFSSLTVMRPPKYLALYKRLFGDLTGWHLQTGEIRMDTLTGCPEEVLLVLQSIPRGRGEIDTTPLHPTLVQTESEHNETRQLVAKIFSETVLLYLHTVLSDSNPVFGAITSSEVDRALVFPICLAGCMTDDPAWRDFLKGRLQALDESLGNLMRTRLLMEAVWQKRDINGTTVDWRETMRERGLNLLLL
ncbi:fungal-specific transcription factor domain-containing protein [Mycena alexandri]|uniref:Fungal-specific transcription factor domain-containing protein n=1 Tax=Mycena alexandri TaxID=1745969 RepID=A0AAD6WN58_9AGAR|nr:fungal-specific transcription factor domain-containing protein [Mycena alexandri]